MSGRGMQGASSEQEAQRLREEVEREQLNVKAALQALEAEKARMVARAAAEKKRLLEKVSPPKYVEHEHATKASIKIRLRSAVDRVCHERHVRGPQLRVAGSGLHRVSSFGMVGQQCLAA